MSKLRFLPGILLSTVLIFFGTETALAGKISLKGTYSEGLVKSRCDEAGRLFGSSSKGYFCDSGKGRVTCNPGGKCTGECPNCRSRRIYPARGEFSAVLHNRPRALNN
jgi:hypothetical protein